MKIQIENLKGLVYLKKLNNYQRSLAINEFNRLVDYVNELEQLTIPIVMRSTLERKEAEYKLACEWFETEYDSISDEDEVAEQEKVCYGLNEQIKLLRHLLSEYCA